MKFLKKRKRNIKNFLSKIYNKFLYKKMLYSQRDCIVLFFIKIKIPKFLYNSYTKYFIEKNIKKIILKGSQNPKYSIIIPVYNNILLTTKCIISLSKANLIEKCEILIIDDDSNDQTQNYINKISSIKYFKNDTNIGFIRSCNKGCEKSSGEYLIFLNNDTVVDKNWLLELSKTFENIENAGLVGSKLVYPNGQLQEAGGIVWSDASAWNWLHKSNPGHPAANYLRDVDYVSGASIMIPRSLFESIGRFDERYQHSYYEDTDLAMSVREAGYRVLYQPLSVVTHHEGASSGKRLDGGAKRYQVINRNIFYDKWSHILRSHFAHGDNPQRASDRLCKGHILIIDALIPTPDRDSGSIDMFNMINILLDLGYRVHFLPVSDLRYKNDYTKDLQRLGVNCIHAPYYSNIKKFFIENGNLFNFVFLCRKKHANKSLNWVLEYCKSAKKIFYTVDLHFMREIRASKLNKDNKMLIKARNSFQIEKKIINNVDATIVISKKEESLLNMIGCKNIHTVPLIRKYKNEYEQNFHDRNGILFIGGFRHQPNVDAVNFLVKEIWPIMREKLSYMKIDNIKLNIVGSDMPEYFNDYAASDVNLYGYVKDIDKLFKKNRISIAPLRYGAGLKGKLATSFGHGVPVIGSRIAFEGVSLSSDYDCCVSSGDPSDYVERIINIYFNVDKWKMVSLDVYKYARENYSYEIVKENIKNILHSL